MIGQCAEYCLEGSSVIHSKFSCRYNILYIIYILHVQCAVFIGHSMYGAWFVVIRALEEYSLLPWFCRFMCFCVWVCSILNIVSLSVSRRCDIPEVAHQL